jgi:exfoliative toxin A/B
MSKIINKLPLPITGLMLGLAALGNLLGSYSLILKNVLGLIAAIIGLLVVMKVILLPKSLKEGFNNPVVASVLGTYPMALMLLSTYLKPINYTFAFLLWCIAIMIHVIMMIVFTKKYIVKLNIMKVFPSYFIMYVGIICASVTAPAYQIQTIGQLIFWFGLITYLILLPIVIYRVAVIKALPKPAIPTLIIFAAPASLCLTGYLSTFEVKHPMVVYSLAVLSVVMVMYALVKMIVMIKLPFSPGYSAFTFPFVISAIAMTKLNGFADINYLPMVKTVLTIFSTIIVIYVLIRYSMFMFSSKQPQKLKK